MNHHLASQSASVPVRGPTRLGPPAWLFALAVLLYALEVVVPLIGGLPTWTAVFGSSLLFALLAVSLVAAGVVWRTTLRDEALLAASLMVAWALLGPPAGTARVRLYLAPAADVLFLLGCLFVGKVLSRIVRERAMALPVCIVAGLADMFTVYWGPTGEMLASAPDLVKKLSLAIPAPGSAAGPEGAHGLSHVATMGLGDFIFFALFMSVAVRFGFRVRRSFWAMAGAACVGITVLLLAPPHLTGMPLLPFICTGFALANLRDFRLSVQESRDLVLALTILLVLFAVLVVARTAVPHGG